MDGGGGESAVGEGGGCVVALAVVEDVGAVKVVDAEGFGKGAEVVVDVVFDSRGHVVDPGGDGVAAGGLGRIDDVLADAGGVELGRGQYRSKEEVSED